MGTKIGTVKNVLESNEQKKSKRQRFMFANNRVGYLVVQYCSSEKKVNDRTPYETSDLIVGTDIR